MLVKSLLPLIRKVPSRKEAEDLFSRPQSVPPPNMQPGVVSPCVNPRVGCVQVSVLLPIVSQEACRWLGLQALPLPLPQLYVLVT